jgi:hypothetical protein
MSAVGFIGKYNAFETVYYRGLQPFFSVGNTGFASAGGELDLKIVV